MAASSSLGLIIWSPYAGLAAVLLSALLLVVGAGLLLSGRRLTGARKVPPRGRALKVVTVLVWALSILLVLPPFGQIARRDGQSSLGIGPCLPHHARLRLLLVPHRRLPHPWQRDDRGAGQRHRSRGGRADGLRAALRPDYHPGGDHPGPTPPLPVRRVPQWSSSRP